MPTQLDTFNATKLEPVSFPQDARIDNVVLGVSLTLAKGTILGKKTSDNKHYAYNDSLTNGTETATCILVYDTVTDANGKVYLGTNAVASINNLPHTTAPVYVAGVFDTAELTGYNAAALADFQGRLLPSGHLRIP
jgi:hypothetical protein